MVFWEREKNRNVLGNITFIEAQSAFASFAYRIISEGLSFSVDKAIAVEMLKDAKLIDVAIRANYVVVENDEKVHFFHELFQDYFAAVHVLNKKLNISDLLEEPNLNMHRKHNKWDQTLLLLCSLTDANSVLFEISKKDPWYAGILIKKGINVSREMQTYIYDTIINIFTKKVTRYLDDYPNKVASIYSLAGVSYPRYLDLLLEAMKIDFVDISYAAGFALSQQPRSDHLQILGLSNSRFASKYSKKVIQDAIIDHVARNYHQGALAGVIDGFDGLSEELAAQRGWCYGEFGGSLETDLRNILKKGRSTVINESVQLMLTRIETKE